MIPLGWIGVGNMGAPMLEALLETGKSAAVFDVREGAVEALQASPGSVTRASSAAELASRCETVFISLPDLSAVRDVVLGPAGLLSATAGGPLKRLVNTSTTGASLSRELLAAAAPLGVGLVDSPVSGGPEAARARSLSVMVSGRTEDIEALRPLLLSWGKSFTVAGASAGAAQTLKLVNNAIIVASYVSTLEAFLFGVKAGLSPRVILDTINAGSLASNGTTRVWLPNYILKAKPFGAKLPLLIKDMGLALSESDGQAVPMWVCEAALQVAKRAWFPAMDEEADLMDLLAQLEKEAGFQIPRSPK